jgi:GNAT superfamily N-acetyltransferase
VTRSLDALDVVLDDGTVTVRLDVVDPADPEARRAVQAYFDELDERFVDGFDPGDGGADQDHAQLREPNGAFVVLRAEEQVVGCAGVYRLDDVAAEIKRMWIAPGWRGRGLAGRTLQAMERWAADAGCGRIVLDTNGVLHEAIALYQRSGYRSVERYNDNPYAQRWFAKDL